MLVRRWFFLMAGLAFFGFSLGLVVRADIGLAPWDVFHQGVSQQIGWSLGTVIIATSFFVVLLWIPIRERPGIGTLANAVLVGLWVDVSLWILPQELSSMTARLVFLVVGIVVNGVATGLYIGARFGSGPRDGLMTGLAARGFSVRVVRTIIEVIVLVSGVLLGGSIGIGTVLFAVAIGPIAHQAIPFFTKFTALGEQPERSRLHHSG
ncbi:MAG: YczE/YyaS/YitT family protein [Ilumatobacteraceae bacterium]